MVYVDNFALHFNSPTPTSARTLLWCARNFLASAAFTALPVTCGIWCALVKFASNSRDKNIEILMFG